MPRHVLLAILFGGGILMLGCSVFVGRVVILPERTGDNERHSFDESAEITAVEIGKDVAKDNGFSVVPGPHTRLSGEDYDTLSVFQRKGRVWLSVLLKDDRSEMVFVITDQGHGEETQITATLRRDVIRKVGVRLPNAEVRYEQRSEVGSLMGP